MSSPFICRPRLTTITSVFLSLFFFPPSLPHFLPPCFCILVFQASETPPCVRLHSVPRVAQAWQSVSKVGWRPCPVAWIGYKLPARAAEELWWMYSIHFSSNPTKNVDELTVSKCGLSKLPSCLYWDGPVRGAPNTQQQRFLLISK